MEEVYMERPEKQTTWRNRKNMQEEIWNIHKREKRSGKQEEGRRKTELRKNQRRRDKISIETTKGKWRMNLKSKSLTAIWVNSWKQQIKCRVTRNEDTVSGTVREDRRDIGIGMRGVIAGTYRGWRKEQEIKLLNKIK